MEDKEKLKIPKREVFCIKNFFIHFVKKFLCHFNIPFFNANSMTNLLQTGHMNKIISFIQPIY